MGSVSVKIDREGAIGVDGRPEDAALFAASLTVGMDEAERARKRREREEARKRAEKMDQVLQQAKQPIQEPRTSQQLMILAPTAHRAEQYARKFNYEGATIGGVGNAEGVVQGFHNGRLVIVDFNEWFASPQGRKAREAIEPIMKDSKTEVLYARTKPRRPDNK